MSKKKSKNNKIKQKNNHFSDDDMELWHNFSKNLDPLSKKAKIKQKEYGVSCIEPNENSKSLEEVANQPSSNEDIEDIKEFEDLLADFEGLSNNKKKAKKSTKKGLDEGKNIHGNRRLSGSASNINPTTNNNISLNYHQKSKNISRSEINISQKEIERRNYQKLKKGLINLDGVIDLHGLRANEAYNSLLSFVINSQKRGHRYILVITGKGTTKTRKSQSYWYEEEDIGVLKRSLPGWISDQKFKPYVIGCSQAHKKDGGEGAYYIHIRNLKKMR